MKRMKAGIALLSTIALAACSPGGLGTSKDGVTAPGLARNGQAVDGLLVGQRLMDAGEYELALQAYSRAALAHGMTVDVLAGLGTANLGLGRLGQSEKLLRRAVNTDQAIPEVWNNLGVVLMERGKTGEAVQIFQKAYALDDGESDSIRDNLRLALAKSENTAYDAEQEQDYKLVRRGSSDYLIRQIP